ncbi:MAG: xylulokinase [Candidatus Acetothermia bacterium]
MSYLIGIDVGTTGCKAAAFSTKGETLAVTTQDYDTQKPSPDAAEQDPEGWWEAVAKTTVEMLSKEKLADSEPAGIGVCGQMHSAVLLDSNMEVVRPTITWLDQRSEKEVEALKSDLGEEKLRSITANFPTTTYTLPHLLWLRKNEEESFEKVRHVLLPKDYIKYRLTGEINTDYSDASGTFLLDYFSREWSRDLLNYLGWNEDYLPPLSKSTEVIGEVTSEGSNKTGLPEGTPVVAGSADQTAGAVGMGSIKENQVTSLIGTAGVLSANSQTPRPDPEDRLMCWAHAVPGLWQNLGVMQTAGATLRWFRKNVGERGRKQDSDPDGTSYDRYNEAAKSVPPGSNGLIFLPYLEGERTPHWDSSARGVFFGISTDHKKEHFIRAIMEGVGYSLKDSTEIMDKLGVDISRIRVTGGGYRSDVWRQIVSDITEKRILYSEVKEGSAFGAALLSGIGTGTYSNFQKAVDETFTEEETTAPNEENIELYGELHEIYQKIYRRTREIYRDLSKVDY